jgi:excisionase family DNA binding protein
MPANTTRIAYSPKEAADATSLSLRKLMGAIASGELRSFKKGRRRVILARDLQRYLEAGR